MAVKSKSVVTFHDFKSERHGILVEDKIGALFDIITQPKTDLSVNWSEAKSD